MRGKGRIKRRKRRGRWEERKENKGMVGIGGSLVEEIKGNPGDLAKPTSAQAVKPCSVCCWLWSGWSYRPEVAWTGGSDGNL